MWKIIEYSPGTTEGYVGNELMTMYMMNYYYPGFGKWLLRESSWLGITIANMFILDILDSTITIVTLS